MKPEMDKAQLEQLTQQLAGIELPPQPNWWPLIWTVLGVIFVALMIALLIWRKKKAVTHKTLADEAPQRLKQIQQQWQSGELDQRNSAYQLATLLRLGLGLKQLDHNTPAQLADHQIEWQATIQRLQQLRYQADSDARLDEEVFATIAAWLKQGRQPC